MESNQRLQLLKEYKDREFTATPSPFGLWVKPTVVAAQQGAVSFRYLVRRDMTNPIGTLQGGVIAAMADEVLGATMYTLDEEHFYTTINLVIDYFSPVQADDYNIAAASIIKKGRQFINAQCEIWNADQTKLVARITSNLFKTDIAKINL